MSEYQLEEELLSAFVKERMRSGPAGEETAIRAADEYMAWKKGMIAEVERAAAEKAWDRCVGEMPIDQDWKIFYGDNNPYRAEAYRQERGERLK